MEKKSLDKPDETRPFAGKGHVDIVQVAGKAIARGEFEPGWRWSTNVKPIAGTDLCMFSHLGVGLQGRMRAPPLIDQGPYDHDTPSSMTITP